MRVKNLALHSISLLLVLSLIGNPTLALALTRPQTNAIQQGSQTLMLTTQALDPTRMWFMEPLPNSTTRCEREEASGQWHAIQGGSDAKDRHFEAAAQLFQNNTLIKILRPVYAWISRDGAWGLEATIVNHDYPGKKMIFTILRKPLEQSPRVEYSAKYIAPNNSSHYEMWTNPSEMPDSVGRTLTWAEKQMTAWAYPLWQVLIRKYQLPDLDSDLLSEIIKQSIDKLALSDSHYYRLKKADITSIKQILQMDELQLLFDSLNLFEIEDAIATYVNSLTPSSQPKIEISISISPGAQNVIEEDTEIRETAVRTVKVKGRILRHVLIAAKIREDKWDKLSYSMGSSHFIGVPATSPLYNQEVGEQVQVHIYNSAGGSDVVAPGFLEAVRALEEDLVMRQLNRTIAWVFPGQGYWGVEARIATLTDQTKDIAITILRKRDKIFQTLVYCVKFVGLNKFIHSEITTDASELPGIVRRMLELAKPTLMATRLLHIAQAA